MRLNTLQSTELDWTTFERCYIIFLFGSHPSSSYVCMYVCINVENRYIRVAQSAMVDFT
jgi:hypothetical protein